MYKITEQRFGLLLTFKGFVDMDELEAWYRESGELLSTKSKPFGVIVDMRDIAPISIQARELFIKGQKMYHEMGMQRSAVILTKSLTLMQFRQLAKTSGIYQWERYFDADTDKDWLKNALLWIKSGVSPDN